MGKSDKETFVEILRAIALDLFFLVVGTCLVGIGSNFYLAIGLAFLLIYHKSTAN